MIIKNNDHYRNSYMDRDFFKEHYHEIEPIKKLSVYFDYQNFIFSDYDIDEYTTFVAEGWNGNQIHLTGLNCGYGGTGPSRTADILVFLGFTEDEAYDLKYNPGLVIHFSKNGTPIKNKIDKSVNFSSQFKRNCIFYLDRTTYVDITDRQLFVTNPQLNPRSLYNIIDEWKPLELKYYLGTMENETLYDDYIPYDNIGGDDILSDNHIIGVNLILQCREINVLCLIDTQSITSVVDMLYYYIFKKSLFGDSILLKQPKSRFSTFLLSLTSEPYKSHGRIDLKKRNSYD